MKSRRRNKAVEISVVMPVYNAESHVEQALDSIVSQSFTDFECVIVDDGSTDRTLEVIRTFNDNRIIVIEKEHDYINSLNLGVDMSRGKYIARMDADDIMHPDRLKIQHTIMETEPCITVCGTWMTLFGKKVSPERTIGKISGLVENPLLQFLRGNFISHPTTMIRRDFLKKHQLHYEKNYVFAEDLKLWTDIARLGGTFYIESQSLLSYRISEEQISNKKMNEQRLATERILHETLCYLIDHNRSNCPKLSKVYESLKDLQEREMISFMDILQIFHKIIYTNRNRLSLS